MVQESDMMVLEKMIHSFRLARGMAVMRSYIESGID
jgi:hypothetical protein